MQEEFVKEYDIKSKSKEELNYLLIQSIIDTSNDLNIARNNYEFAEGELIDYYLYQIKANQAKLDYLIKKSKANNITMDKINQSKLKNYYNDNAV